MGCLCAENGTSSTRTQMQVQDRPWSATWILPAATSFLADDPSYLFQQPSPLEQGFCRSEWSSEKWNLGFRVHWHQWLSQRQELRNVRWLLRSCPGLGWAHCSQQTWLRSPSLREAAAGSGCGDSGHAGSGHRGGGAAPSPCAGRKSRSTVRYCSHCTSHWLCGHSSSSSRLTLPAR